MLLLAPPKIAGLLAPPIDNDQSETNQKDAKSWQKSFKQAVVVTGNKPGSKEKKTTKRMRKSDEQKELEVAFRAGRILFQKLASACSGTTVRRGAKQYDIDRVVKRRVALNPLLRRTHVRESRELVLLLDISPSCAAQSEMFAAIAAGVVGQDGAEVYFGFNGDACSSPMKQKSVSKYASAKRFVDKEIDRIKKNGKEISFAEFSKKIVGQRRLIIFGDFDGLPQYVLTVKKTQVDKSIWFCNQKSITCSGGIGIPKGYSTRNFFPEIFTPKDLTSALRRVRIK